MRLLLHQLEETVRGGTQVVYTALVETRGSTPQKAGAAMLVFPDGSQSGTLGGGCVEAEVKQRALRLLDRGCRDILTFHLDSDYGWDDGLICGGRMRMLVDPVCPGDDVSYFNALSDTLAADSGCTEVIIIDPQKAGGGILGDRYLLDQHGDVQAVRGDSEVMPPAVVEHLRSLEERPRPYVAAGVSYLPCLKRCRLLIVGGGHVGQEIAKLAAQAGFDIWVVDDRQQYCNPQRFPQAKRLIVDVIDTALSGLDVDDSTFCVIVTRGHNHDEQALHYLAQTSARYIGMIGSKRKIKLIFDDLLREGVSPDALRRVHAPIGFHIGSQSVPEIGISIVAELIAFRNLGSIPKSCRSPSLLAEITEDEITETV